MKWLVAAFNGIGIGLLISPAFFPDLVLWNLIGFVFVAFGFYFMNKIYG